MHAELRHTCYRCGGSCQGPGVPVSPEEEPAIAARAAELAIPSPMERTAAGARMRTTGGRCVFLQEDNLCALHLGWGASAKPVACRTFPRVEHRGRAGVDPGCLAGFLTPTAPFDDVLSDVLAGTLENALGRLVGEPASPGRPPASVARWMQESLPDVLAAALHPSIAPGLRARLRHLTRLRGAGGPSWTSAVPETHEHALDVTRRMVGLGLVDRADREVALHTLRGAALCAWADPAMHRFAPALAAWTRLQRDGRLLEVLDRSDG